MMVIGILFIIVIVVLLFVSLFIFLSVEHKSKKVIDAVSEGHPLFQDGKKLIQKITDEWKIKTKDGLNLDAWYIAAEQPTDKYVLIANGYHGIRDRISGLAYLFHDLGYHVLIPAYRASAEAEGKYIGFGWLDRDDYKRWIKEIIVHNAEAQITMMGLSMGAASTMMLSGEALPGNVKCFIADCGYDSVWNEIAHNAKVKYRLPAFPLVYLVSFWSKLLAGYSYQEASTVRQLAKNTRPILFIHGNQDDFVPTKMVYRNYDATRGSKELLLVKNAAHAVSYETDMLLYRKKVENFLKKYF